ncbi:uncharacterized protein LOC141700998 [Apium graveolens]|uniref:uncharacterized protein LOC141700998 n=1 Tax=Apium graveolens TaxID=4045 RepID=UPI003D7A9AE6
MPGIDPNLITHRLNVDPTRKAVKQKKRTHAPDRLETIKQEVEKLLEARFIEEVKDFDWIADIQEAFEQLKKYMTEAPLLAKPSPEDTLYLYLMVSEQAVSAVLVKEEKKLQKPVYYASKVLHGAELNYSTTEKFALALITALRKLKPYFQAHKIEVLKDQPVRNILHSPRASGRLIKWAIGTSKTKSSGAGLVLQSPDGFMIEYALKLDFPTTNNEAEYEALIDGLGLAKAVRAKNLQVIGDSRLVVAQVNGECEAKNDTMAKYLRVVKGILTQLRRTCSERGKHYGGCLVLVRLV